MSATDPQEPEKKKPGPKPEVLDIDPEEAEEILDHLLGKKPKPAEDEGESKPKTGE